MDASASNLGWTAVSLGGQSISFGVSPSTDVLTEVDLAAGTWQLSHGYQGRGWSVEVDLFGTLEDYR